MAARRFWSIGAVGALAVAGLVPALPAVAAPGCSRTVTQDADGNGISDPVIGAPGANGSRGTATPFRGTTSGPTARTIRYSLSGAKDDALFGDAIAWGDANGDRCADVAVSAPAQLVAAPSGAVVYERGTVTVLAGRAGAGLSARASVVLSPSSLHIESAGDTGDSATQTLSQPVFGDFDGDGYDDLALLDEVYLEGQDRRTDEIVVVPGSARGLDAAHRTRHPLGDYAALGTTLTLAAGHVRSARYADLAVALQGQGEPSSTTPVHGDRAHPTVRVLYGGAHGLGSGRSSQLWDRERGGVPGTDLDDETGQPVAVTFGDFDGDGHDELAIGLPHQRTVVVLTGATSGLTGSGARTFSPGRAGMLGAGGTDAFGTALAAGDFNGDGDDELAIGWRSGRLSVLAGTHASGLTTVHDLLWSQSTAGVPGVREAGSRFGAHLAVGWYGHGRGQDLLVSDPAARSGAGSVTALFGSTARNVGLTSRFARVIDESTPGVPGVRQPGDAFGGR